MRVQTSTVGQQLFKQQRLESNHWTTTVQTATVGQQRLDNNCSNNNGWTTIVQS